MSWAKMPSAWLRPIVPEVVPNGPSTTDIQPVEIFPLTALGWRKDGSSSMAALMLLIALSIRLNQSLRGVSFKQGGQRYTTVAVTFDELQRMTGFARSSVSSGLGLLEDLDAIKRVKIGRANYYELIGVDTAGEWCQLPQSKLLRADGSLSIKPLERKRSTLHALKIYILLAALRNQKFNTTAISYSGIMKWTGLRRADIGPALQILIAWELIGVSDDIDQRHLSAEDRSKRYRLTGLGAVRDRSRVAS
ncbi:hypothetical protein ACWKWV_06320 [Castellaniella ginsengisoli]